MTAPGTRPLTASRLVFSAPPDWAAIHVPRRPADAALARQLIAARPGLADCRDTVGQVLRSLAAACEAADVRCACTTTLAVPGGSLPATLLVSSYAMAGQPVDRIAARLAAADSSATGLEVGRFDLPIGRTARVEWRPDRGAPEQPRRPGSLVIQYVAGIPGTANAVILTFATPAVTLAAWLRPLFHQIAGTVRMEHPDREQERSCT